jgi:hypothetical protein
MPLGIEYWCDRGLLALAFAGMGGAAQAQSVWGFECPARVSTVAAALDEPVELRGFAWRFPAALPAHLLRVTVQQGSGKEAADIKPQVHANRLQWALPSDRSLPTTLWCQYEGGVALARVLRHNLVQCTAERDPAQPSPVKGMGPTDVGLGRVSVSCQ